MSDIDYVISQLERQRAAIEQALVSLREISSDRKAPIPTKSQPVKRGGLSKGGRARIAEAARKRWAAKRTAQAATKGRVAKKEAH